MNRLGRGLVDLIPVSNVEMQDENLSLKEVYLKDIYPSELQPRKYFDDSGLRDLADSIKQHGLAQPILVRETDKGFEIIAGERRFRACLLAKLEKVLVCVRNVDDKTVLKLAMVENLQRKNLTVFELAKGYEVLMREYQLKQEDLAVIFNKSRAAIANQLRLLKLPDDIQKLIQNRQLGEGHARALLGLKNQEDQLLLANEIVLNSLSVREVELKVKEMISYVSVDSADFKKNDCDKKIKRFNQNSRYSLNLKGTQSKGSLEIVFKSPEDLDFLLDLIETI